MNKAELQAELKALQQESVSNTKRRKELQHVRAVVGSSHSTGAAEIRALRKRKKAIDARITEIVAALGKTPQQVTKPLQEPMSGVEKETKNVMTTPTNNAVEMTVEIYKRLKSENLTDREIREEHFFVSAERLYNFKRENGLGTRGRPPVKTAPTLLQEDMTKADEMQAIDKHEVGVSVQDVEQLRAVCDDAQQQLAATIEALKKLEAKNAKLEEELASLSGYRWRERFRTLGEKQAELDAFIEQTQGLRITDHSDQHLLALIVELAEVAQEEKSFKYWKKQKVVDKELLLEEAVDVLHFILSRGNLLSDTNSGADELNDVQPFTCDNITVQILELINSARHGTYQELVEGFVGLTHMFGFEWSDVEAAYDKKFLENKARQTAGY